MQNLYQKFHSHENGLLTAMVARNREEFGSNELEIKQPEAWWQKLLKQFADLLVIVLIVASILSFAFGETIDAIVILAIVIINALIGFFQEFKTERMLEALSKLISPNAKVLRNGKLQLIPAKDVVVGDILILEEGMKVASDAILLEANSLEINEAILTGESLPVKKDSTSKNHELNSIFASTEIVNGSGKAIVSAVGSESEFGKIAKLTTHTKKSDSPLTKEMKTIGVFVGKVSLLISLILLIIGYFFQDYSFITSLLFAVAVAVAAVPEGLPVTITTALALGMRRLAEKQALVRELKSVETLGATTVICSDKTGTLTRNEMVVRRGFLTKEGIFEVSGSGYNPKSGKVEVKKNQDSIKLFEIMDRVNEAELIQKGKRWKILGDPTEGALKVVARKFGVKKGEKILKTFPFDSNRKRMSVVVGNQILVKGATEFILAKCNYYLENGKVKKLTSHLRKKILKYAEVFADDALRVLAAAYRKTSPIEIKTLTTEKAEKNLVFVGFLGMYDSPRKEVKEAVTRCFEAGIRITIITGDNGITAKAIARELDIADKETKVITGDVLKKLSEAKLKKILQTKENLIFARVKPVDKLRIVEAYKKLDEVVAVTGDGVNDAPALKRADIGVAMGRCGADVAKEAASLILTNDSFASIVTAVAEGRRIYANMRKFILYVFSSNVGELVVVFAAVVFAFPAPLTAVLILMVDLGTDLLPSLALGVDPLESATLQQPPRNPSKRIMDKDFIIHLLWIGGLIGILVLGGYFWILHSDGWYFGKILDDMSETHKRGMSFAFATLVIAQLCNSFNFRSESESIFSSKIKTNRWLWWSVMISTMIAFVVVEIPFAQTLFHTASLTLFEWLMVFVLSSMVILFEEIRKLTRKVLVK